VLRHPDNFFHSLSEPYKSCLLFLQAFMLQHSERITESWKFNTPFYYYDKKWLGFISYHPKTKEIYISFTDGCNIQHPSLVSDGRKKAKIFRVEPNEDIDVVSLKKVLEAAIDLKKVKRL
jgi:hypothetical protein